MAIKFLSDDWFVGVQDIITRMGGMEPADKLKPVLINVFIKTEDGSVSHAHFKAGVIYAGHDETAKATLTTTRELFYKVMVLKNMAEGVRAIMTGKAKLGGESKQLMSLSSVKPSAQQADFERQLKEMTEL
jgi:Ni,Fe-hydrogenase III component G